MVIKTIAMARSKTPRSLLSHSFESLRHAQFNRKSNIFGLQIRTFQGCSFPNEDVLSVNNWKNIMHAGVSARNSGKRNYLKIICF